MTLTARLASFFDQRPHVWIDGRELAKVAGFYSWRTRLSEHRQSLEAANLGAIEQRTRRVKGPDGKTSYVVSEYRYVPKGQAPLFETIAPAWSLDGQRG